MESERRAPRPRSGSAPRGLPVLLVVVVAFGLLAAVLSRPAAAPSGPAASPTGTGSGTGPLAALIVSVGILAALFGWLGWEVYVRLRDGRIGFPSIYLILILAVLLIGLLFVALFHVVAGSLRSGGSSPGTPNSSAGPGSGIAPGNHTGLPNGTLAPLPTSPPGPLGIPWVDLGLLLLGVGGAVGALWLLRYRAADPETDGGEPPEEPLPALRKELRGALERLRGSTDPREAIRELYGRLLDALDPRVGSLAPLTAREIELRLVTEAGAGERPARELRELFEEARYSTHPMTARDRDRAAEALEAILADLERRGRDPSPAPAAGPDRPPTAGTEATDGRG